MADNSNLIRNGGFESGTFDYWTQVGGQIVQLPDAGIPGLCEAKFTVGEPIFTALSTTDLLPVGPNREYEIAFDLWGLHGDAINYSLQECNQDGAIIRNTQYTIPTVPVSVTQFTKRHVTGAGAAFAILTIFSASENAGDYFYLNDISVFELNAGLTADIAAGLATVAAYNLPPKVVQVLDLTTLPGNGIYQSAEVNLKGYKKVGVVVYSNGVTAPGGGITLRLVGRNSVFPGLNSWQDIGSVTSGAFYKMQPYTDVLFDICDVQYQIAGSPTPIAGVLKAAVYLA